MGSWVAWTHTFMPFFQEITPVILAVSIILPIVWASVALLKQRIIPSVIVEFFIGVVLGATVLGNLLPSVYSTLFVFSTQGQEWFSLLVTFSAIFLLFVAGLEIAPSQIIQQKKYITHFGILGVVVPFLAGILVAKLFSDFIPTGVNPLGFYLTIGSVFTVSALPVIARVLIDYKLLKTRVGSIILGTATVNDVIGWAFLIGAIGIAGTSVAEETLPIWILLSSVSLLIGMALIVLPWMLHKVIETVSDKLVSSSGTQFVVVLPVVCLFCVASLTLGLPPLFGAFLAGISLYEFICKPWRKSLRFIVAWFFAPIYFVTVGLQTDFIDGLVPVLVLVVIVAAFLSKFIAALIAGWLTKLPKQESMAIGVGLAARGGMEVVVAHIAYEAGVIEVTIYTALIAMAIITSITAIFIPVILRKN
jgi:Kef-type K+ transport system membrane component KefB